LKLENKINIIRNKKHQNDLMIEVGPPLPLTDEEKSTIYPCLKKKGLNPGMLDIITNIPHRTHIIKVRSKEGKLLGLTNILLTPSIFMKHYFGEGNQIGTNHSFFFTEPDRQAEILSAIFNKLIQIRPFGYYVGLIAYENAEDFRSALNGVPHIVAQKVLEKGSISTRDPNKEQVLFKEHKHLSRQIHRFLNKGGTVHFHEGPVCEDLANAFVSCCKDSYVKHVHPGRSFNIDAYGDHVRSFLTSFPGSLHIYAKLNGKVVGVQTFIKHVSYIELTEGGFSSSEQTYHAYENIIVASIRYAVEHGLDKVSYGLISNPAKDRLMDKDTHEPIFLVMFFRSKIAATVCNLYRYKAHKRFSIPYWRDRSVFHYLPI
jgi:hypothetical protein